MPEIQPNKIKKVGERAVAERRMILKQKQEGNDLTPKQFDLTMQKIAGKIGEAEIDANNPEMADLVEALALELEEKLGPEIPPQIQKAVDKLQPEKKAAPAETAEQKAAAEHMRFLGELTADLQAQEKQATNNLLQLIAQLPDLSTITTVNKKDKKLYPKKLSAAEKTNLTRANRQLKTAMEKIRQLAQNPDNLLDENAAAKNENLSQAEKAQIKSLLTLKADDALFYDQITDFYENLTIQNRDIPMSSYSDQIVNKRNRDKNALAEAIKEFTAQPKYKKFIENLRRKAA